MEINLQNKKMADKLFLYSKQNFPLRTGKYGPEKTPYLDTFHTGSLSNHTAALSKVLIYLLPNMSVYYI